MRANITILVMLSITLLYQNQSFSQDSIFATPTYTLTATNISRVDPNTYEWDVFLLHTNGNVTTFIYGAAQYFFNFNTSIFLPGDSLKYSIVSSDLPSQYRPVNASISGNILRLASNLPTLPEDSPVISTVSPGTKVLRLRLKNFTRPFQPNTLGLEWRSDLPNPFTRISVFTGENNTILLMINTPITHFVNTSITPILNSPSHNSINNYTGINFIWNKTINSGFYHLQIFSDSLSNSYFYNDSTLTDTSKFINGLSANTKYYWRVGKKDSSGVKYFSFTWNFRTITATVININLTVLSEGKYNNTFNLLSQKDSMTAFLRNSVAPYNIIDSAKGLIDTLSFTGLFSFYNSPSGTYYIAIKNKQCLETWSKTGGESLINNNVPVNYDFTSAATKAYGSNLRLKGSKYCIYSGDINQDGFITLFDFIPIYNGASNFAAGYNLTTDLTGDSIVDLTDVTLCYNNSSNFIRVRRP
jgi:hypothetical protein